MKTSAGYKIWGIVYPIGMFYVVASMAFFMLGIIMGTEEETYVIRQGISDFLTIPVIYYYFYRLDLKAEKIVYGQDEKFISKKNGKIILAAALAGFALPVALTNIIYWTGLMDISQAYNEVNSSFFAGSLGVELLANGFVVPMAEELLFRGVVFKRAKLFLNSETAIFVSALIFGIIHFNIVQFIYAFLIGLVLAYFVDKSKKLYPALVIHVVANIISILRQETGILNFGYSIGLSDVLMTVGFLFIGLGGILMLNDKFNKKID